jgi:hypothetical protein
MHKQLTLDVIDCFIQCIAEFFEIFLVEENLVLFVFFFPYPLAFGNGDVEILLRFRGLHIKKIRAFTRPYSFREDFVFIRVFQGCNYLPSREPLLKYDIHCLKFETRNSSFLHSPFGLHRVMVNLTFRILLPSLSVLPTCGVLRFDEPRDAGGTLQIHSLLPFNHLLTTATFAVPVWFPLSENATTK